MKLCVDCKHCEKKAMQVGQGQMGMIPVCIHPQLADPIQGDVLPCQVTRGNEQFCGITGKYFKLKPVSETPPPPKSNLIAIS